MSIDHSKQLEAFSEALMKEGFSVNIIEKSEERPYETVLVFLTQENHPAGGLQLELSFIPNMEEQLAGLSLLQCFVDVSNTSIDNLELEKAVTTVNQSIPLVGFGILAKPTMLCFRHTLMLLPKMEDNIPLVIQTTWLISYLLEVFEDNLTQIAEEKTTIAEAFDGHPFAHLLV